MRTETQHCPHQVTWFSFEPSGSFCQTAPWLFLGPEKTRATAAIRSAQQSPGARGRPSRTSLQAFWKVWKRMLQLCPPRPTSGGRRVQTQTRGKSAPFHLRELQHTQGGGPFWNWKRTRRKKVSNEFRHVRKNRK